MVDDVLAPLGITSVGFGAPTGAQPWGHRSRWHGVGRGAPVDPGTPERPEAPSRQPARDGPRRAHPPDARGLGSIHQGLPHRRWHAAGPASIAKLTTPPEGKGPKQAIGWAIPPGKLSAEVALGQQGSNTAWVATALIGSKRDRAALVVCNDGRGRMLAVTGHLAVGLLASLP